MKKTLRSALSLVLALVLCTALVLPASARSFTDENEISNGFKNSVSLMASLDIINGIESADGSVAFKPKNSLTREEAAKVLAYVFLGNDISSLSGYYEKSACGIKDIADSWAKDYIAYCYDKGIVNGDGNGRYFPQQTLSLAQAAKLLLSAAGYNDSGRYTGDNWNRNVMADAASAGLFDEFGVQPGTGILYIGSSQCSREQFCSMAAMTLTKLCKKDSANTLGKDNFNVMGVVTGEVSSLTGSSAVITGAVTTNTVSLILNTDGTMYVAQTAKTAPVSLTVPASGGVVTGMQVGFLLKASDKTSASQLDTLLLKTFKETDPTKVPLSNVGTALKLDASVTPKMTNGTLAAKVSDTGIEGAVSSEAVSANGADLNNTKFADSVSVYESGKTVRTVTAAVAKQLCELNPGSTMNVLNGVVESILLVSSGTTGEVESGDFPSTCIYYGEYATRVDADGKLYWEMEVYGEGKTRTVDIYELTIVTEGTVTKTPGSSTDPNTCIRDTFASPIPKVKKVSGWACVLRLYQGIGEKRSATVYGLGSAYASALYRVKAYDGTKVLLAPVLAGGGTGEGIEALISDEYYGGCYDLRSSTWCVSELSIDDYVVAFHTTEDSKEYLRAAYQVTID